MIRGSVIVHGLFELSSLQILPWNRKNQHIPKDKRKPKQKYWENVHWIWRPLACSRLKPITFLSDSKWNFLGWKTAGRYRSVGSSHHLRSYPRRMFQSTLSNCKKRNSNATKSSQIYPITIKTSISDGECEWISDRQWISPHWTIWPHKFMLRWAGHSTKILFPSKKGYSQPPSSTAIILNGIKSFLLPTLPTVRI